MLLTRARPATLPQRHSPGVTHGAVITEPFYSEPSRAACSNREITECWESAVQAGGFGPGRLPTPASVGPPTKLQGFHLPHDKVAPWCGATCVFVCLVCVTTSDPRLSCRRNVLSIVLVIVAECLAVRLCHMLSRFWKPFRSKQTWNWHQDTWEGNIVNHDQCFTLNMEHVWNNINVFERDRLIDFVALKSKQKNRWSEFLTSTGSLSQRL